MSDVLTDDLQYWYRVISPHECDGLRLYPDDCYRLGLVLECAYEKLLQQQAELDIERSKVRVLDPEGSRLQMELQRQYGAPPDEQQPRGARGRSATPATPEGKSVFRNL